METIKKLEKLADKLFSQYVRLRDSNPWGKTKCCTCGHIDEWRFMDLGHYLSRKYYAVRFDEMNTGVQCRYCNRARDGEQTKFLFYLEKRYGKEAVEKVDSKAHEVIHDKRDFLLGKIEQYTEKFKKLKNDKDND